MTQRFAMLGAAIVLVAGLTAEASAASIPAARQRFSDPEVKEVPDFQRHILPLMGRLGCNTRSCHGSFQGQGGFRLSLFGYDFKMDHEALLKKDAERVVLDNPEASKILAKPTLTIPHKGGKRMEEDSWQYRMFVRWIEEGAKGVVNPAQFERLEVTPSEIVFHREGEQVPLKVVAHWSDGTQEDVTCITRYRTNDESIAEINDDGLVTSKGKGDTHVVAFYDNGVAVTQVILPLSERVGPKYPDVPAPTRVDELVQAKLRKLGVVPAEVCTDAEFLRRVSLDVTGTLPSPDEVRRFLADSSPRKRAAKVDELLQRSSYAAWWTNKLCDLTGNSPRNIQAQQVRPDKPSRLWYEWIYRRVKENVPYDQIVAGIVVASSRTPGQSYDEWVKQEASYYRDKDPADFTARETMPYFWVRRNLRQPEEKALGFSYTFLGVRLECAQCHKHPFDQWTQDDFNQFTAFFRAVGYGNSPDKESREAARKLRDELGLAGKPGNIQRQIFYERVSQGKPVPFQEVFVVSGGGAARQRGKGAANTKTGRVFTPKLLGAEEVSLSESKDPRQPLMDWMRRKDNPYFARAFVNRVWANYFGSGIINPPDDSNLANPPSNAALLDYLAQGFIEHGFDMKWLHREIVLSDAYQRSWQTNETNRLDSRNFSHAEVRRLPAEVLIDAVAQATASHGDLDERFKTVAERAIGPNGMPGINRRGVSDYAARVFGRSLRDTNCDCSRSNEPNLLQSIYLQNDQELLASIERSGGWVAEAARPRPAARPAPADPKRLESLRQEVARLDRRIKALKDDDKPPVRSRIEKRRDAAKAELAKLEKAAARPNDAAPARSADVETTITEAYLRTLSRLPAATESQVALDYFRQSSDEQKGLRDLLWALLNTKEFITNH